MGDDSDYTSYGPYAVCTVLQEEHGKLIADSDWPALAMKLPESNVAMMSPEPAIQCYKCHQWGHKANDPKCPLYQTKTTPESSDASSEKKATSNKPPGRHKQKDPWKYIEPKDISKPVIIDGKKWFYCSKCRCRATGQLGFYQLSHTDATHDPNWSPESNHSPVQDPDPSAPAPICPPSTDSAEFADDDPVYTGIHFAPVLLACSNPAARDKRDRASAQLFTCLEQQKDHPKRSTCHTI